MHNRATLKQELESIIAQWDEHKNPKQTLAALEKIRTIRWQHLGLAIAVERHDYDADLMHAYINLLTTLADNPKTSANSLINHLSTSSPNDHLDLPAILVTQRKDAKNTQQYIQLLQTIANRRDVSATNMAQLISRRFRYNLGSEQQPVLDSSNLLMEITNELDKETLRHYLQLLSALINCDKIDQQTLKSILRTPSAYPQNIGSIINAKLEDPKAMLMLVDLLAKLRISNFKDYLPRSMDTDGLLKELDSRSISERESLYPKALSANEPLHYLLQSRQDEVRRLFALTRQDKLLETITQMSPQEQVNAYNDALDPQTFFGKICYAVDSAKMRERILELREEATSIAVHGSKLMQDIFSTGDCEAEVISFTNTQTGLFKPAKLNDEDISHAFQQAFTPPNEDDDPYERVLGTNR